MLGVFTRRGTIAIALAAMAWSATAYAGNLPAPTGRVLLTLEGNIANTNSDGKAELDRAMLEAIGMVEVETWTPFTEGSAVWGGVPLRALLDYVGAQGDNLKASALDLYTIDMPASDADEHGAFLALYKDGKALRVRDKGPAWILYPFVDDPTLDNEVIAGRCVWQLASIRVE